MEGTREKTVLKEETQKDEEEVADFEKAMEAAGFGTFNIILVLVAIPSCLATSLESSTMSFILPSAECDLNLTLLDKGLLNAVTYAGMITSAVVWGYLADTKGRKKVLVFCYLVDFLCVLGSALSQNVTTLMIFKYFGGFVVNGTFAILTTYLSELHGSKYRSRVTMVIGMLFSLATVVLPCLAWIVLPNAWNYHLIQDVIVIHSWQVFLAICALPSLMSGLLIMLLPESPKFLMSQGRNEEALKVFRKIYTVNHRNPSNPFPISTLLEEVPQKGKRNVKVYTIESGQKRNCTVKPKSTLDAVRKGLKRIRPMFIKPYLSYSIHVCSLQFCILLGLNTIRLWLPQLFAFIAEFEQNEILSEEASNLCDIIEYSINKTKFITTAANCEVTVPEKMYSNAIIVGLTGLFGYFIAGTLINAMGAKWILISALIISGLMGMSMYLATDSIFTVVLSSIYVTVGSIGATSLIGVVVDLFPTSLRTTIISILMMFGRLGALIGNILFPYFMTLGCIPPFLMVSCIMFIASGLSTILPYTKKSALK